MDASVFVRKPNVAEYTELGLKKYSVLPRRDEYIDADFEGSNKFFQVVAVHHTDKERGVAIYAVQADPPWMAKKGRAIGFGS